MTYIGKMCVSRKIGDVIDAHRRGFPDIPITHAALPRSASAFLRDMYLGGYIRVDGTPLELTDAITPPPGNIWSGHISDA